MPWLSSYLNIPHRGLPSPELAVSVLEALWEGLGDSGRGSTAQRGGGAAGGAAVLPPAASAYAECLAWLLLRCGRAQDSGVDGSGSGGGARGACDALLRGTLSQQLLLAALGGERGGIADVATQVCRNVRAV